MRLPVHAPGDALDGAEEIYQRRHTVAATGGMRHLFEQRRGPSLREQSRLDLRHLQDRRDRSLDAHEPARGLEPAHEISQRGVGHGARADG